jgi:uncharacterized membrane protein YqjE
MEEVVFANLAMHFTLVVLDVLIAHMDPRRTIAVTVQIVTLITIATSHMFAVKVMVIQLMVVVVIGVFTHQYALVVAKLTVFVLHAIAIAFGIEKYFHQQNHT